MKWKWSCNIRIKIAIVGTLAHISLASFLWNKVKQYSPRCNAAERSVPLTWGFSACVEDVEEFHRKKE